VSPALAEVLAHCDVVVSVHGFGRDAYWTSILVGGADRALAAALSLRLRDALPDYDVLDDLAAIPSGLRGLDPRNPVNRGRGGGVQLELPPRVRGMGPYWSGHAGSGFTPHSVALVDALAEFATRRAA
jgi:phage replication-related protein YjqB (UPF0714/DUF867 family)